MTAPPAPPASGDAVYLDHVGFIVRDLPACAQLAQRLGFTLTQRADHTRTDAQGRAVPAGSAQHSIMLHSGYVELMQITDPQAGHQLAAAPQVRHGLHILALGTGDAQACHAQRSAAGVPVGPVLYWTRPVQERDLQGTAQFAYFGSDWTPHDPSYLCWVEHRTPQLLRNTRLLQHAQRTRALDAVDYAGPAVAARRWVDCLVAAGAACSETTSAGWQLTLPQARITVRVDDTLSAVLPQALVFRGADTQDLRRRCDDLGLACHLDTDGTLAIDLVEPFGMRWTFRP